MNLTYTVIYSEHNSSWEPVLGTGFLYYFRNLGSYSIY